MYPKVLSLTPKDVGDRRLILKRPKSGRQGEAVFISRKLHERLSDYIREKTIQPSD